MSMTMAPVFTTATSSSADDNQNLDCIDFESKLVYHLLDKGWTPLNTTELKELKECNLGVIQKCRFLAPAEGFTFGLRFSVKDLKYEEYYYFKVTAVNNKGPGPPLESIDRVKLLAELSAPVGPMKISNITESSVDIEWEAPKHDGGSSIKEYLIEYRLANTSVWEKAGNVDGNTYRFSVKNLKYGEYYFFKVTAVNNKGPGPPLESKDPVKLLAELSAPVGPMKISNITESSVDIEWEAPKHDGGSSIKEYLIEYRLANTSVWEKAGNIDGNTYRFSVKDLKYGEYYYFKVTAVNNKGPGPPLESIDRVKLLAELSAPVGPMKISNITESSVDIEWEAPKHDGGSSIKEYLIEYRLANTSVWEKAGNVDGNTYRFSVKDLKYGEYYYFKVTAVNNNGPGPPLESIDRVKLLVLRTSHVESKAEKNARKSTILDFAFTI
ncbi:TTN [Mytilus edulis]|uniref:TTN n=1 Tax=Mytilus edulis TaxID=6550 RepID=A0A8S3U6S7_MYTED|nr:TTN [Mytilus edulis]